MSKEFRSQGVVARSKTPKLLNSLDQNLHRANSHLNQHRPEVRGWMVVQKSQNYDVVSTNVVVVFTNVVVVSTNYDVVLTMYPFFGFKRTAFSHKENGFLS